MDIRVLGAVTIGLLTFIWYLAFGKRAIQAKPPSHMVSRERRFSDPAACAQILACIGYNTGARNLETIVRSRAIPNERLTEAYGIDNSFTTSEDKRRKEFNLEAVKAIKMTDRKWKEVADFAKELVGQAVSPSKLTDNGQTTSATLDSLVRSVCLKVVLHVLFEPTTLVLDDGNISIITESINKLWVQSKGTGTLVESDKHELQRALCKVIPQSNPAKNPLNLIIPAYESLWRVVLSGFLQVTFVKGVSPKLRWVLANFLANPTTTTRKDFPLSHEALFVSVDFVVMETLRLYPSVKRVFRQFKMDNGTGPEDVAADIEKCQRTKAFWGIDAERFVPSRWMNVSDEARKSYMAFGVPPFVCPAKADFGPMIIGILVAAFADHISSEDWHLRLSNGSLDSAQYNLKKALSGEEPLASGRNTYEGIRIVKK